jgi:hypothetical protein
LAVAFYLVSVVLFWMYFGKMKMPEEQPNETRRN